MHSGMDIRTRRMGFPIRRSQDHSLVASFPGLIAGSNVLHRLLTPSHPPRALSSLITPTSGRRLKLLRNFIHSVSQPAKLDLSTCQRAPISTHNRRSTRSARATRPRQGRDRVADTEQHRTVAIRPGASNRTFPPPGPVSKPLAPAGPSRVCPMPAHLNTAGPS